MNLYHSIGTHTIKLIFSLFFFFLWDVFLRGWIVPTRFWRWWGGWWGQTTNCSTGPFLIHIFGIMFCKSLKIRLWIGYSLTNHTENSCRNFVSTSYREVTFQKVSQCGGMPPFCMEKAWNLFFLLLLGSSIGIKQINVFPVITDILFRWHIDFQPVCRITTFKFIKALKHAQSCKN